VQTLAMVLRDLGLAVENDGKGVVRLETVDGSRSFAGYELVRRMRASFCVLGPLLARRGRAVVALPGGCNIGPRPVDLHLSGLAALGAELRIESGHVIARARRLKGAQISLAGPCGPTVTGTANVLSAAVLADGATTINGAALEPEIVDLGNFLNRLGARISGLGTPIIRVEGVSQLGGGRYRVIPDRIEAATLLLAAAIAAGELTVTRAIPAHLHAVLAKLEEAGFEVRSGEDWLAIRAASRPRAVDIVAEPYPGIPTDVQAQFMALLALAKGTSTVGDRVFRNRFQHVAELNRLGARIQLGPEGVVVCGVERLSGATVQATDLRASAALILAGLAAEGKTVVEQAHHLDRGYQRLDEKLNRLGARIVRVAPGRSGDESPDSRPNAA